MASLNPDRSEWDVIVIGGGPPGENVAQYATQFSGLEAVIVENELVGGECSYWACMPSKSLLRPIELLDNAKDVAGTKQLVEGHQVDAAAVLAHRDEVIHDLDDASQVEWATGAGIDVVRGIGRLDGPLTVRVTDADGKERVLTARHAVVLDTGTTALVPDVRGLREARPWISRDVTNLHEVPRRVVILGGGVVACEAATWLRGLGVEELTMLNHGDSLLAKLEPFAGDLVRQQLEAAGVGVRLGVTVASVSRPEVNDARDGHVHGGEVTVTLEGGERVVADEIVAATGRSPRSNDIGLESVGLTPDGYVDVDDHLGVVGVEGDWLYAIGDLNGRALLTHMGKYQARVAGEVIAARATGKPLDAGPYNQHTDLADNGAVPQVTFTNPEVGSAGRTEQQARDDGLDVTTVEYDIANVSGAYVLREHYVGRAKLVIDRAADVVVGATFVGTGVAELTHSATMAIVGRIPVPALWHVVPSYPTVSEVWLRLLETFNAQNHKG